MTATEGHDHVGHECQTVSAVCKAQKVTYRFISVRMEYFYGFPTELERCCVVNVYGRTNGWTLRNDPVICSLISM